MRLNMRIAKICFIFSLPLLLSACGSGSKLTREPIKWVDPDNSSIREPKEIEENQIWDIVDHTFFYPIGKMLDLGYTGRRIGSALGIAPPREADNLNALDEAPNSSWFTNRHFLKPMSQDEIRIGPGIAQPDTSGPWTITAGKFEGGTAGFTIKDSTGQLYLLKFDSEDNNEMGSAAEVIATKLLHAAGYNVPPNSVVYFDPAILRIGEKTTVPDGKGGKRPMLESDKQGILDNIIPQPDGRLRCLASRFLENEAIVGIFDYHGLRRDDPNDRVRHHHRRELRGLRVIGSWMNDADRRAANTLDVYIEEDDGRRYVKHYLIDMGSTFGSNNLMPHLPKYGNEYVWDPRTVGRSLVSFGLYRKPWEEPLPMPYPELGYFENKTFRPEGWVPTYPNVAFQRCTAHDGYWGAKLVMSFSDKDIATAVEAGRFSNTKAAQELTRLLAERRDMIGSFWFQKVNPLDKFWMDPSGLHFTDLAVSGGLMSAGDAAYSYRLLDGQGVARGQMKSSKEVRPLPVPDDLATGTYYGFEITANRKGWGLSQATRVYFYLDEKRQCQIVRVERES
jgi:hypothetical protein